MGKSDGKERVGVDEIAMLVILLTSCPQMRQVQLAVLAQLVMHFAQSLD